MLAGLIITGCSASQNDQSTQTPLPAPFESAPSSSAEETQSLPTPQEMWQQAIESTSRANATAIEVQLITNVEGFERIVAGVGYAEMDQGFGDIIWTDDLGTTREVITEGGHFLELDGTWLEIEDGAALPTTVAFDPLAGLVDATNVVDVGNEDIDGASTIRLDADVDANVGVTAMGFSQEELTVFADAPEASLIATIWVNADGRIVRILREYEASSIDGDPITATNFYLLSNQGEARPIDVPETADALPAPA